MHLLLHDSGRLHLLDVSSIEPACSYCQPRRSDLADDHSGTVPSLQHEVVRTAGQVFSAGCAQQLLHLCFRGVALLGPLLPEGGQLAGCSTRCATVRRACGRLAHRAESRSQRLVEHFGNGLPGALQRASVPGAAGTGPKDREEGQALRGGVRLGFLHSRLDFQPGDGGRLSNIRQLLHGPHPQQLRRHRQSCFACSSSDCAVLGHCIPAGFPELAQAGAGNPWKQGSRLREPTAQGDDDLLAGRCHRCGVQAAESWSRCSAGRCQPGDFSCVRSPCPHGDGSAATGTCGTTRGAYWTARASRADFLSAFGVGTGSDWLHPVSEVRPDALDIV
mmetsp:Transcript_13047/g.18336  ORF Transcript_13047/g.18336 Transcript_13047/m.18336 type:complete len:333 (-) Transcript_13047:76-1074(-)